MATFGVSTLDTAFSIDMRDLVYSQLPVSKVGQDGYGSDFLNLGHPGFPHGTPPPLSGHAYVEDYLQFGGSFTFDEDGSGNLVDIHGAVTNYFYEISSVSGVASSIEIVTVSIDDFALDISQFRTLADEQLSELIFAGNDSISGDNGADTLLGFDGDDFITGEGDADVLYGGGGSDTANYGTSLSGLYASLANPSINTGDAKGDQYHDIENLRGTDFADALNGDNAVNVISGDDGGDTLKGYGGGDELRGGRGDDVLIGGAGADKLSGDLGTDTASYLGATAGVYASLANAVINTNDAKGDSYQSVENLIGTAYADRLNGNTFDNVIDGGAGDDMIKGYDGNDTLIGGAGSDIFIFNTPPDRGGNVDTIVDFNPAEDTIQLDDAVFSGIWAVGTLQGLMFRANTSGGAQGATDRIIYETDTGRLFYDADGFFSGVAIHFATLSPNLPLQNVDFVVI
ncbi:calcium-binding protein [Mesorhizobium sp. CN2-181]|uniref:calcium-binding protein n=1 Tax=Mesorhizobium yinganensis TaxID=3157707 RepID=UPI0032B86B37